MTVEIPYAPTRLNGDGFVSAFAFTFISPTIGDVKVTLVDANNDGTPQVLGVDYTVVLDADGIGGTVTMIVIPLATEDVLMELDLDDTQITDIPNVGGIQEEKIEVPLDRRTLVSQLLNFKHSNKLGLSSLDATNLSQFAYDIQNITSNGLLQINSTGKGVTTTALGALSAIGYPVTSGIAVATGSNTFIARELLVSGSSMTITNRRGVSGNPIFQVTEIDNTLASLSASIVILDAASGPKFDGISAVTTKAHSTGAGTFTVAHNMPGDEIPTEIRIHANVYDGTTGHMTSGSCTIISGVFSQCCAGGVVGNGVPVSGRVTSFSASAGATLWELSITDITDTLITFTITKNGSPGGQTAFICHST